MIGLIMERPISSPPIGFIIFHALVKGCTIRLSNKRWFFFCATGFEIGNMTGRAQRKLLKKEPLWPFVLYKICCGKMHDYSWKYLYKYKNINEKKNKK